MALGRTPSIQKHLRMDRRGDRSYKEMAVGHTRIEKHAFAVLGCFFAGVIGTAALAIPLRNPPARAAVSDSVSRTATARSSRFTISVERQDPARRSSVGKAHGLIDFRLQRGWFRFEGSGSEVRFEGATTFVNFPFPGARTGVKWLRTEDGEPTGADIEARVLRDPVGLLRKVRDDVRPVGREEIAGIAVTRYDGSVAVPAVVPASDDQQSQSGTAPSGTTVSLWIDDGALTRRVRLADPGGEVTTIDFYDFGVDVPPVAPPVEQVMTIAERLDAIRDASFHECGDPSAAMGWVVNCVS